jgi:hypothetical protein
MHNPEMTAAVRAAATVPPEQKPADDTVRTKAWDPVEVWRKRVLARDSSTDKADSKAS